MDQSGTESSNDSDDFQVLVLDGNLEDILELGNNGRMLGYEDDIHEDDEHLYEHRNDSNNESEEPTIHGESTFDMTLPTTHSYLGNHFKELRGRTLLDDGIIYKNLPLLANHSIILFPGQTLPMRVYRPRTVTMLQNCMQKDHIFGVVCLGDEKIVRIGTTAEIYEYDDVELGESNFQLKAKGRQRFMILQVIMQDNEMISANVKILPEVTLDPPFLDYRLASLDHLRIRATDEKEMKQQNHVERIDSIITPWPAWIYQQYDPLRLSWKIRQHLQYLENFGGNIPKDPIELSYWVAQNVLVDSYERISLLNYDCAIERLQREIKYLIKNRSFVCVHCDAFIAHQSNMFPMSKEGLQNTYCNGYGIIHETITVYHAEGLKLSLSPPSTEYSWFPGYAWTIAHCKNCYSHMGWKFTAVKDQLKPETFWGLTRKALKSETNINN